MLTRKWADINWKERSLRIPNGKTGYRVAPILPEALKVLEQMREQFKPVSPKERIFPMTANAVHMIWSDIKKKLNLENLHWHDLRHEGCSRAAKMLNFDIAKLQKVSGHKNLSQLILFY